MKLDIRRREKISVKSDGFTYSSARTLDVDGDWILGNQLFILSDICVSNGAFVFENDEIEINFNDPIEFSQNVIEVINKIFKAYKEQKPLVSRTLGELKTAIKAS